MAGRREGEQTKATASSSTPTSKASSTASKRMTESLGWLTESTLMPKKHKAIEGVGAASILELKAQLYRSQEQARKDKATNPSSQEFHRAKKKILPSDVLSTKNSGVDSRARKDKLELKAETDGSKSYAALEKKAELYEKLARGELPDEEEKEKYCVDFFRKSITQDEQEKPEIQDTEDAKENQNAETEDNDLLNSKLLRPGRTGLTLDSDEHKRFVREVHEEVNQARHEVTTGKLRRQEQEAARREKLKQAYLRKRLEKLLASKKEADAASSEALGV
ncbi:uncharacterized protein A4U43_C05F28910 [Asparagus officinalis]|uniref:Uncharacterized protein n=1 Tax=Asparagus officinalis TaxID=4686 RepID=A0A5P1EVC4_ASPOF|nr:uncharacterized protein At4g18257-like [Asparagus officinalis]ONK69976.1 uncharacterized protein A4U43_C05F28910 [Asparagus officinalis]